MEAKPFWWWLRPVRKHERVGEHSAVVCHCEYVRPLSASRCIVGMLMRPPYGDHAAWPVSSYRTTSTLGAPSGARSARNAGQSPFDSRTSSLISPLNGFAILIPPLPHRLGRPMRNLPRRLVRGFTHRG